MAIKYNTWKNLKVSNLKKRIGDCIYQQACQDNKKILTMELKADCRLHCSSAKLSESDLDSKRREGPHIQDCNIY